MDTARALEMRPTSAFESCIKTVIGYTVSKTLQMRVFRFSGVPTAHSFIILFTNGHNKSLAPTRSFLRRVVFKIKVGLN